MANLLRCPALRCAGAALFTKSADHASSTESGGLTFPSTLEHKNGAKLWNLAKWPIGVSRLFESSCHKMKWCENTVSGL